MAKYQSLQLQTPPAPVPGPRIGNQVVHLYGQVDFPAAPTTADTIEFFDVPAGFRVTGGHLKSTDMDTNGSPALAFNIGDASVPARIFAASNVGQAGTLSTGIAVAGSSYQYQAKTRITGVVSTNAATGVAGSLYLTVTGFIDALPSLST